MHLQDDWCCQDDEARHREGKAQEAARHREWLEMEHSKLDLEERRLQQMGAADEARGAS